MYSFSERSTVFGSMSHRISAPGAEWAVVSTKTYSTKVQWIFVYFYINRIGGFFLFRYLLLMFSSV
jgi:hypothetical protein